MMKKDEKAERKRSKIPEDNITRVKDSAVWYIINGSQKAVTSRLNPGLQQEYMSRKVFAASLKIRISRKVANFVFFLSSVRVGWKHRQPTFLATCHFYVLPPLHCLVLISSEVEKAAVTGIGLTKAGQGGHSLIHHGIRSAPDSPRDVTVELP